VADEWARPSRPPAAHTVEVPLVADQPSNGTEHDGEEGRAPKWRRTVSIALVGGLLGGIALSTVLLGSDDEPESGPTTAPAPEDLADRITTPPTLSPVAPLPLPDDPALADAPTSSGAETIATPPTYPAVSGVDVDDLDLTMNQYDLDNAVLSLGYDAPRRSQTHVELGAVGYVIDVTIVRDQARDRYHLTLTTGGNTQIAIVDGATDTTYVNPGTDNRVDVPNAEVIAESTASTVNEYFDRLMAGPLRPDTIGDAEIDGRGLVRLDDAGLARQFVATIQGALIPEWQLYAFSPVFEFPVEDRPPELEYSVYVDGTSRIVRVDGVSMVGDVPQLVQHRVETLAPPESIDLAIGTGPGGVVVAGTDSVDEPATVPPDG